MRSITDTLSRGALLALFTLGSAFAIRPAEGPMEADVQGRENPHRAGFRKMRDLVKHDLLDQGEALGRGRVGLTGDPASQILRRLNQSLRPGSSEVRITSVQIDGKGNRHIRLLQHYKGIPVIGADMVVHVNPANEIYAVGGALAPSLDLPGVPKLKPEQAALASRSAVASKDPVTEKQPPRLVIFNDALAYETVIQETGKAPGLWKTYVDAQTGELLARENQILHGAPVGGASANVTGNRLVGENGTVATMSGWRDDLALYFLRNNTNLWGVYDQDRFDWSQNSTGDWAATDRAAVSLARNMELTQGYVSTILRRNSFDNAGAFATAYAHEGDSYVNAYWDGSAFHFGDGDGSSAGPLTVLDVAAHEYGHAITQYTSSLVYSYESGALNESYSDIHGALVEFWAQPDGRSVYPAGTDGQADWLMGEDCWLSSEALRDLRNPLRFGQPSYYLGTSWYTGGGDNGGVHYNSGVQNFAFYLLSEGGNGSNDGHAYNITGLGIGPAGEIAMYANMFLLTSTSQYRDAREAWILAATTLGYNAQTVRDVWTACGVLEQVNNLAVSPSSLGFGNVAAGSTGVLNLTLTNSGAIATTVTGLNSDNAAFSASAVLPIAVAGGASIQLPVRFSPPAIGPQAGVLTIASNADDFPTLTVNLAGAGTAPPGIEVSPTGIDRAVAVGESTSVTLRVINTGVADLVFTPDAVENQAQAGPQATNLNVLMLRAGVASDFSVFESAVRALPNVGALATWDGAATTPTLAQLQPYDAVIAVSNNYWASPAGLGDVLADYVDAGGSVILMGATFHSGGAWVMQGRIMTSAYAPLTAATYTTGSVSLASLASHPINTGVSTLTSGLYATNTAPQGAGLSLGTYTGGYLLGAYNPEKAVVSLNSFPVGTYYGGDLLIQIRNALDFMSGGRWLTVAGEGQATVVPQGAGVDVLVNLKATEILGGAYSGTINLVHNVPGVANPLAVPVTFAVDGFRRLAVTPAQLAFGNRRIGSTAQLSFTLTNTGDEATNLASFALDNAEFSMVGTLPTVLAGRQSAQVQVAFAPVDAGDETGILTITSDAEDNPILTVALGGTGTLAPQVTLDPTSFSVSLATGDQTTRNLSISNPGGDNLIWSLQGAGLTPSSGMTASPQDASTIDILAWVPYTDMTGEYLNVVAAIDAFANPHTLTNSTSLSAATLETELAEREVFLMPERELGTIPAGTGAAFASVLEAFLQRGGVVIMHYPSGTDSWNFLREANLMNLAAGTSSSSGDITLVDAAHPLMAGVTPPLTMQNATVALTVADNSTVVATYSGYAVVAEKAVGRGRVVMMGLDFFAYTPNWAHVLSNAVNLAPTSASSWLSASSVSGIIPPGGTGNVLLTFNAANMLGGTYQADLALVHDAPGAANPLPIPTTLVVDGVRSLTVTPDSVLFGDAWSGTRITRTVTLANTGSEATTLLTLMTSGAAFSTTATLPMVLQPFQSATITLAFAPADVGAETGSLVISSDAEDNPLITVILTGTGTAPPAARLVPAALTFNLAPTDAPADGTATLSNVGGDVLTYQIAAVAQTGSPLFHAKVPGTPAAPDLAKIYSAGNYEQSLVPGEVIVALKPGLQNFSAQAALGGLGIQEITELAIARNPSTGLRAHGGRKLLLLKMQAQSGFSLAGAIGVLRQDQNVEYAEPNYVRTLVAVPNDASFGNLYGMHNTGQSGGRVDADIDAPEAWDSHTGNKSLVLGVIDTGIDYLHPDLAANIWSNAAEAAGVTGVDDDGNGYIDDIRGFDFVNNDANPMDDHYHGTHVAGTIAGVGNNGIGVAGVAWTANLAALKIFNASGSTTDAAILNAVDYSNAMGMRITSNSWGGGPYSQSLFDLIAEGRDLGHLFIAAAGNNGSNTDSSPNYPSGYALDNIISVAATDRNDLLASFSNYGLTTVDLGAPGVDTYSCQPGGGYQNLSGTSMATPHVSGAAYLVWSSNNLLTAAQVKAILLGSVDAVPALSGRTVTGGRLNVAEALADAGPSWLSASPMTPGTVEPGASAPLNITVNPTGLVAGTWTGTVRVATNDPAQGELSVSVTANISGCRSLVVAPTTLDFGAHFVGTRARSNVTLRNECNDAVTVSAASGSNPAFSFGAILPLVIPAFTEIEAEVTFDPAGPGPVTGDFSLTTNADSDPIKSFATTGTGVLPPLASVNPGSVTRTVGAGRSTTVDLDIGNAGGSVLNWQLADVDQGWVPAAPYDATHFAPMIKEQEDTRMGRPVLQAAGGPDAFGYRWSDSDDPNGPAFQWTDISTTGTLLTTISSCDDCYQPQALSFPFTFYGTAYTSMYVTSNGYLTFGTATSSYTNYPLPSTSMAANLVAGFYDDLYTSGAGEVYFRDFGDRAIIQYQNVPRLSGDGTVTFQIVLQSTGAIYFYYQNVTGNLLSATTGIQNAARTVGLTVQYNTAYVKNGLAVRLGVLPDWLRASALSGSVEAGANQQVVLTLDATGLMPGVYTQTMTLTHNNPLQVPIEVPVTMTVGSLGYSRVLRVGPSALSMAAGSRHYLWNVTVGGETRGLSRGSRHTLYLK